MADAYYIEEPDFRTLQTLCRRMFGDGSALTTDDRRDIANLFSVILSRVEQMPVDQST